MSSELPHYEIAWRDALRELQLQMTRGTFDTWWEEWKAWVNGTPPPPPPPPPGLTFTFQALGSLIILRGNHPVSGTVVRLSNGRDGTGYVWQATAGHKPELGPGGYEFSLPASGDHWLEYAGRWYGTRLERGVTTAVYG